MAQIRAGMTTEEVEAYIAQQSSRRSVAEFVQQDAETVPRGTRVPAFTPPDPMPSPTPAPPLEPPPSAESPSGTSFRYTPPEERTLGGHLANYPRSAGEMAEGFYELAINPLDTLETVGKLGMGALSKLSGILNDPRIPPELKDTLRDSMGETTAEALVGALEERYGSWDAFSNTAYNDPVGLISDVAGLVSLGGTALRAPSVVSKASIPTRLGRFGEKLQGAARRYEPVNVAGHGLRGFYQGGRALVGKTRDITLGLSMGGGPKPTNIAFNSPGSPDLRLTMQSKITELDIVDHARGALYKMREFMHVQYQGQLANILKTSGDIELDLSVVQRALNKKLQDMGVKLRDKDGVRLDFSRAGEDGVRLDFSRAGGVPAQFEKDVAKVWNIVQDWGTQTEDTGVLGMDTLKKKLNGFYRQHDNPSNTVARDVAKAVREELGEKVPGYTEMMKEYERLSELILEIESELGLGSRRTRGASMRKLATVIAKDNDYRQTLVAALDEVTTRQLEHQLAGFTLRDFTPQTLVGRGMAMAVLGGGGAGAAITAAMSGEITMAMVIAGGGLSMAMANSPRLVGEVLVALGLARQWGQKLTPGVTVPVNMLSSPAVHRSLALTPPPTRDPYQSETLMGPPPRP